MQIHKMSAAFGKLQKETLVLREGLNIIQAPNDASKAALYAFLLTMFFGNGTRTPEGAAGEKAGGMPTSGRVECLAGGRELVLTRSTRRKTAPMGEFKAVYADTGEPVPGVTGLTCGEILLGVNRETYARSAWIRQASSDPQGPEVRAGNASRSGDGDTFINESGRSKAGRLPALEEELRETERKLAELAELEARLPAFRERTEELKKREAALAEELAACERWEANRQLQALTQAETDARETAERAADLRRRTQEQNIPENGTIGRLRGAIVNLETARRSLKKAQEEQASAQAGLAEAEGAVNASPFAGHTPEEAEQLPLEQEARPRFPLWGVLLALALGLGLWAALYFLPRQVLPLSSLLPLSIGCGCGGGALCFLILGLVTAHRQKKWEARTAELREQRQRDLEDFTALYRRLEEARSELDAKSAAVESLNGALTVNEQGILLEVQRFAPAVRDVSSADAALRASAVCRKELSHAEAAAQEAQSRYDLLVRQGAGEGGAAKDAPSAPPMRKGEETAARLKEVRSALAAARSEGERMVEKLRALGDPASLRASAVQLKGEIRVLEAEYGAIAQAMESLEGAGGDPRAQFTPELGKRSAEIFRELTDGQYTGAALDQSLQLTPGSAGGSPGRDAALLSAGAADQLYLAVRLAICGLVLPEQDPAPIILDDALAGFDDARCASALRYLRTAAKERQILLFTCHGREAEFFAGDARVSIQQLTDRANLV